MFTLIRPVQAFWCWGWCFGNLQCYELTEEPKERHDKLSTIIIIIIITIIILIDPKSSEEQNIDSKPPSKTHDIIQKVSNPSPWHWGCSQSDISLPLCRGELSSNLTSWPEECWSQTTISLRQRLTKNSGCMCHRRPYMVFSFLKTSQLVVLSSQKKTGQVCVHVGALTAGLISCDKKTKSTPTAWEKNSAWDNDTRSFVKFPSFCDAAGDCH